MTTNSTNPPTTRTAGYQSVPQSIDGKNIVATGKKSMLFQHAVQQANIATNTTVAPPPPPPRRANVVLSHSTLLTEEDLTRNTSTSTTFNASSTPPGTTSDAMPLRRSSLTFPTESLRPSATSSAVSMPSNIPVGFPYTTQLKRLMEYGVSNAMAINLLIISNGDISQAMIGLQESLLASMKMNICNDLATQWKPRLHCTVSK
jgi:hypothetical protein